MSSGIPARAMRADARRSLEAILAAAGDLFADRGVEVQMPEIAERAGVGMGTLYRHFETKQALFAAIIGRRFVVMTELARVAAEIDDPDESFRALLISYLEAASRDAAFRYAILGPEKTDWAEIADQKTEYADIAHRILERAMNAGHLRSDIGFRDFVRITRGAIANMRPDNDNNWRRYLELVFEGIYIPRE